MKPLLFELPMYLMPGGVQKVVEQAARDKLYGDVRAAGYEPVCSTLRTYWTTPLSGTMAVVATQRVAGVEAVTRGVVKV